MASCAAGAICSCDNCFWSIKDACPLTPLSNTCSNTWCSTQNVLCVGEINADQRLCLTAEPLYYTLFPQQYSFIYGLLLCLSKDFYSKFRNRVKNVKAGGGSGPWRKNQYIILHICQWTIEVLQVNIFLQVLHSSSSFSYTMFPYVFYQFDVSTAGSLTHQDSYAFSYIQRQLCSDATCFNWYSCWLLRANQCLLFVFLSGCL